MALVPANITAELLEHADGRPIAYIDATTVAIFAYQQPDGIYVVDISTRDDIAPGQLCLFLDGTALLPFGNTAGEKGANDEVRSRSK
jgi:hypothetical protein